MDDLADSKDSDGDGIPNDLDLCPDKPGPKMFAGCPDTDGDGLEDTRDLCPEVAGIKALNGCPDVDGDGVPDKDDDCPNLVNIGSTGKPKDGTPNGCYVLLTINSNSSILNKDAIQVEFVRFAYDVEKAARAIEDSPLPNEYADMLRKGY